jgi:hybrid cluster-associated redox disulfide protein
LTERKDAGRPFRHSKGVLPPDLLNALVFDVLKAEPATARVFNERGMCCVGCPFARFETIADVAAIYHRDAHELAAALRQAAASITATS